MKKILLLISITLFYSCKNEPNLNRKSSTQSKKTVAQDYTGKSFFDFDQATHYKYALTNSELYALDNSENTEQLYQILGIGLRDSTLLPILESKYFSKYSLDTRLKELDDIFTFRNAETKEITVLSKCKPTFRDILIFRRSSKIVGIASICFSCGEKHLRTWGAKIPTHSFGKSGEYEKLVKLLSDQH